MNQYPEKTEASAEADSVDSALEAMKSRRQFLRASAIGGTVLLTLRNRAAWGDVGNSSPGGGEVCVSASVWQSYKNGDPSSVTHHEKEVADFQNALNTGKYKSVPGSNGKICIAPNDQG